ncbi:uncharacterized protein BDR25DRAFT_382681 [Lindgomyces ingoldianus]|uniref:Uncharacterized protein n=1 Tax=Lindgomyces ingoldianus TaxID=673940 RepID=A0ACB6R8T4_9PLEO|nr:uncharacterized protein BDR25DRAFT_382681 [Lindgomyces ingoldianus]KAF2475591.1 hypothetical protein BDR25DRAFT_382681 [Lindgomyces ingoldianus]
MSPDDAPPSSLSQPHLLTPTEISKNPNLSSQIIYLVNSAFRRSQAHDQDRWDQGIIQAKLLLALPPCHGLEVSMLRNPIGVNKAGKLRRCVSKVM